MGYPEAQYVIDELSKNVDDIKSSMSSGCETFMESGTFTVPEGVHKIIVTAFGAGGGGAGSLLGAGGGGGGGACIQKRAYKVTPGEEIPITIGSGGVGGKG